MLGGIFVWLSVYLSPALHFKMRYPFRPQLFMQIECMQVKPPVTAKLTSLQNNQTSQKLYFKSVIYQISLADYDNNMQDALLLFWDKSPYSMIISAPCMR